MDDTVSGPQAAQDAAARAESGEQASAPQNVVQGPWEPQGASEAAPGEAPSQQQDARGQFAPGNKLGPRFRPGQSGNPKGTNGYTSLSAQIAAIVREIGEEAVLTNAGLKPAILVAVRRMWTKAMLGDVRALEWLADRGYGKVPLPIRADFGGEDRESITDLTVHVVKAALPPGTEVRVLEDTPRPEETK